jgi:hypothetical protein
MKFESNIKQVTDSINLKLKGIANTGEVQRLVATYLRASNLRRIHNEGTAVSGIEIGHYGTKPIYVNPKNSPIKFSGEGKKGRKGKTRYFKTGYKGFREYVGREISVVNLQMSGKLKNDWVIETDGKNYFIGFKSKYGSNVSKGNEEHFGKKIWGVTTHDHAQIKTIVSEFLTKRLNA